MDRNVGDPKLVGRRGVGCLGTLHLLRGELGKEKVYQHEYGRWLEEC